MQVLGDWESVVVGRVSVEESRRGPGDAGGESGAEHDLDGDLLQGREGSGALDCRRSWSRRRPTAFKLWFLNMDAGLRML